tara:strand:- start:4397 stop:4813 length:417 start_codon:yes stop_codon:yes gene_type:complete
MRIAKLLTIQEMVGSPEEAFKFVRCHDTKYGWHWKFCHMVCDHQDMLDDEDIPLSAGYIFVVDGEVSFPEDYNLPNYSTTLKTGDRHCSACEHDLKNIPLLFAGQAEVVNGKCVRDEFRDDDDSSADGDERAHRRNSS